ncbi:MAG TPA: glycosyl hydrolase family 39 [Candidatus Angelobacter sp.]
MIFSSPWSGSATLLRITFILMVVTAATPATSQPAPQAAASVERIEINLHAPARPFPHYWERVFGSGRAVLALREEYRRDLRAVKAVTEFQYVRFHDILDDSVGVYDEDAQGNPVYNFSYVDQIYDGLLQAGVRPFVELSFMPRKLSVAPPVLHPFWYKPIVSAPRDWDRWGDLVYNFTRHVVDRYGIDEVSKWYFEVWNEPNLDFWAGDPKEATYYQLYDHAARAIKRVDSRLRVGGPATAQAAWVDRFIRHCVEADVPVDFVSTHVYGNDRAQDVFGTEEQIPRDQMVCRAVKKVYDQVKSSARPNLPIEWTEYNASYMNEPVVTDSVYMGPWLANTIRQCDGLVHSLSYWTFSDVFDEQGVPRQPFYGGFGLIAMGGIPKPAFNSFELLHQLGEQRIPVDSSSILVTRQKDNSLVIALWNYSPPGEKGASKEVSLHFAGMSGKHHVSIQHADEGYGAVHAAYEAMGSPKYPTPAQIAKLQQAAQLPPAQTLSLTGDQLKITLPPYCLALVEIR